MEASKAQPALPGVREGFPEEVPSKQALERCARGREAAAVAPSKRRRRSPGCVGGQAWARRRAGQRWDTKVPAKHTKEFGLDPKNTRRISAAMCRLRIMILNDNYNDGVEARQRQGDQVRG